MSVRSATYHKVRCPLKEQEGYYEWKPLLDTIGRSYPILLHNILVQGSILVDYLDHPKIYTHHLCPFGCAIGTSLTKPTSIVGNHFVLGEGASSMGQVVEY